jgi:hypothetical protein
MALANLPGRNERSAPTFDESRPQELTQYFTGLQALLHRFNVINDEDRKQAAVRYLKIETENLWKTTSSWSDPTQSFDDFKAEVFRLYPGATGDRSYTLQSLDLIIGHYARTGILSSDDLGEYYRRFILVSRYLISKGRLSTQEQSRSFFRGLPPQLEALVKTRLQQKFIDHFPDDPYNLPDIYDAVSYVLMGSAAITLAMPPQTNPIMMATISPSGPDPNSVKIEALTAAVASLGEMFKSAIIAQQAGARPAPRSSGISAAGTGAPGESACNFCGLPGHYIRECEVVAEYTRTGKCKRSPEGRVVLPSGAMVPRSITGAWLRDRVDEYHRQNPGQMAAQMLFEVAAVVTTPPNDAAGQSYISYPARRADQYFGEEAVETYALNRPPRPRPEVVITTRPPRQSGRVGRGENAGGANSKEVPQAQREESPPSEDQEAETSTAKKGKHVEFAPEPTHPYANVPDAIHSATTSPPRLTIRGPANGKAEPAYTTTTKVYDPHIAKIVYERAMETPITVTQRELLSLSPEVRAQIADITVKKRMAREQAAMVMIEEVPDDDGSEGETFLQGLEKATAPAVSKAVRRTLPANAAIIADPYEAYLRENVGCSKHSEPVRVAAKSNAL